MIDGGGGKKVTWGRKEEIKGSLWGSLTFLKIITALFIKAMSKFVFLQACIMDMDLLFQGFAEQCLILM